MMINLGYKDLFTTQPPSRSDSTNFNDRAEAFNADLSKLANTLVFDGSFGSNFPVGVSDQIFNSSSVNSGSTLASTSDTNLSYQYSIIKSSNSASNSGYYFLSDVSSISLSSGSSLSCAFKVHHANAITRIGFQDSTATTESNDCAYIRVTGTTIQAVCRTVGNETSVSLDDLTLDTWYHIKITIEDSGYPTFTLYDSSFNVIETKTVARSIIGAYYMGMGILSYYNGTPSGTQNLSSIEYMVMT